MLLVKNFIKSGIYLGHQKNNWNAQSSYYLYGIKDNIHIIDIEQSMIMLRRALQFIKDVSKKRGKIIYLIHGDTDEMQKEDAYVETTKMNMMSRNIREKKIREGQDIENIKKNIWTGKAQGMFIYKIQGNESTKNKMYIREGIKYQIPIIGIIDSNCNPFGIEYPIPGNDDSIEALNFFLSHFENAFEQAKKEEIGYTIPRNL